jgi:hypothetical protein
MNRDLKLFFALLVWKSHMYHLPQKMPAEMRVSDLQEESESAEVNFRPFRSKAMAISRRL